ncbi:MAG TPA: ribonuclease P protein component [Candidatus Saccharimonadales bacterium]|nr:ribonuclease P protein component [Candidatus Saccharimonadales bacterium]
MLNKSHRFHGRGSLKFVYRFGQTLRGDSLSLKFKENPRRLTYRCAVIVSRKIDHSAVVRNRIRRRVYAEVRAQLNSVKTPYELVFTVTSGRVKDLPSPQLKSQISSLLKQAKIIDRPVHDMIEQKET